MKKVCYISSVFSHFYNATFCIGVITIATTRIIAIHASKGRKASTAISAVIDYVKNPEKTNNGEYISSYMCDSRAADTEFLLSKRHYYDITGRN